MQVLAFDILQVEFTASGYGQFTKLAILTIGLSLQWEWMTMERTAICEHIVKMHHHPPRFTSPFSMLTPLSMTNSENNWFYVLIENDVRTTTGTVIETFPWQKKSPEAECQVKIAISLTRVSHTASVCTEESEFSWPAINRCSYNNLHTSM
jgi:hypothetical protein